jgi:DNA uptake protein ComE-like DNA-binding protein
MKLRPIAALLMILATSLAFAASANSLLSALGGTQRSESKTPATAPTSLEAFVPGTRVNTTLLTGSPALTAQFAHPVLPDDIMAPPQHKPAAMAIPVPFDLVDSALAAAQAKAADPRVRINEANAAELQEKLKLDPRRARIVIEYREIFGPLRSPEDLTQIAGIADERVIEWEEQGLIDFEIPDQKSR